MKFEIKEARDGRVEVYKLEGGTVITDVPGQPNSIYMKMDKSCCNSTDTVSIKWKSKCSVLFNLKAGTLRAIPYDSRVTVLSPDKVVLRKVQVLGPYLKENHC